MIEKACRTCRSIVNGPICAICNSADNLTKTWEGHIIVIDPQDSEVATAIGAKTPGRYALKLK